MLRRKFLHSTSLLTGALFLSPSLLAQKKAASLMSVSGTITPGKIGQTLIHEHVMVDFIGAGQTGSHRYDAEEVFNTVLPYLQEVKKAGCTTFVECTPAYIGRDVKVLKRLAEASGLNIITNTGYYGAAKEKYLPQHAYDESAEQLAERWIKEWREGIDGTEIFPGFIKTGVDNGPLSDVHQKLLRASAIAHLATGLSISAHTGDGEAALEEFAILRENGVDANAMRWVHAQSEKNKQIHLQVAKMGGWVEFDGIGPESLEEHIDFVKNMKENGQLHRTLVSHDAGWYHVGEPGGGNFRPFTTLFEAFIPALENEGFTQKEINLLLVDNPRESLTIGVRKAKG